MDPSGAWFSDECVQEAFGEHDTMHRDAFPRAGDLFAHGDCFRIGTRKRCIAIRLKQLAVQLDSGLVFSLACCPHKRL